MLNGSCLLKVGQRARCVQGEMTFSEWGRPPCPRSHWDVDYLEFFTLFGIYYFFCKSFNRALLSSEVLLETTNIKHSVMTSNHLNMWNNNPPPPPAAPINWKG